MTKAKKNARVFDFIQSESERKRKRPCHACMTAKAKPQVDEDIRAWLEAWSAGEAGDTTWTRFVEWLKQEHDINHGRVHLARHASECLGLPNPTKSYA